ncbi:MAG: GWxTD domain-containing protein [Candidatus Kapabacteria bacterium]|nr:GWxTD domain-containing protein [Candidatus Kapabacteria bacterium]MDW8011750.1 GWxTD domain-containing protein [Bacteroidota bacterium]
MAYPRNVLFIVAMPLFLWGQLHVSFDAAQFWHEGRTPRWELYYAFPDTILCYRPHREGYLGELYFGVQVDSAGRPVLAHQWVVPVERPTPRIEQPQELIGQQNFLLAPGEYRVRLVVQDVHDSTRRATAQFGLSLRAFDTAQLQLSDIQLAILIERVEEGVGSSPFHKGRYRVVPNPTVEYRGTDPILRLYVELYGARRHAPQGGVIRYELQDAVRRLLWEMERRFEAVSDALADVLELPLNVVPSGVYFIRVVARSDRDSTSAEKRFYVLNPEMPPQAITGQPEDSLFEQSEFAAYSEDRVAEELEQIAYLATPQELEVARSLTDLRARQRFLFRFWLQRDPNPLTAVNEALEDFRSRVQYANTFFASPRWRKGWRSDRGRVLLKYGRPTQRESIQPTPERRPYEAWFYSELRGGTYFYFVDLTGFNDYVLVHSTCPGEPYAPDWQSRYLPLGPSRQ